MKKEDQIGKITIDYLEVWSMVNLLKNISGFTLNFTLVGRYYRKCYGGLIILLSEVLSFDIKQSVESINAFLMTSYQFLSLSSEKKEDII